MVNCVRFCPKGELLSTTGDDGNVLLWIPSDGPPSTFGSSFDEDGDAEFAKEHWRLRTMCRATQSEIYDSAWSPSGDSLVIGGTDFVARIINANDGTVIREISEHSHYIQGVAWDPLSEYIATQSSDRSVHVHQLQGKPPNDATNVHTVSRNSKMDLTHRRVGSNSGHFVWDPNSKPPVKRRASSHASDSEKERDSSSKNIHTHSKRSSTPMEVSTSSSGPSTHHVVPRAATPTMNHSPAVPSSMNPPQRTPSRRSSFSGSAIGSPPTSATSVAPSHPPSIVAGIQGANSSTPVKSIHERPRGSNSRSTSRTRGITPRSPSPAPPLPAIRAPPSPKQRIAALQASQGGAMARAGMRMYGDENFSGFFRRLCFSPDGSLLVTPTGVFESISTPAQNSQQSPVSPTVGNRDRDVSNPGSPITPMQSIHGLATSTERPGPLRNTVYMYARGNLQRSNAPIAHLPGHKTATLVVKFSPILYELRRTSSLGRHCHEDDGIPPHPTVPLEVGKQKIVALGSAASSAGGIASSNAVHEDNEESSQDEAKLDLGAKKQSSSFPSMIGLPYRMIFAVATHDSVWIYDTQQGGPLCCFSNMHYASFTDLTWSPDGQTLMMCSTDGYCSSVVFDYGELGTPYNYQMQPSLQGPAPSTTKTSTSSPMLRRSSAQSLSGQGNSQLPTPPMGTISDNGVGLTETSPSLGLGLATSNGGILTSSDNGKDAQEIDPPVVSAGAPSSSAPFLSAPNGGTLERSDAPGRKKRRIAPTLEGPIGS